VNVLIEHHLTNGDIISNRYLKVMFKTTPKWDVIKGIWYNCLWPWCVCSFATKCPESALRRYLKMCDCEHRRRIKHGNRKYYQWGVCGKIICTPLVNIQKTSKIYGKSPSLIGKSTIYGPFSIGILNYQRVFFDGMVIQWWNDEKTLRRFSKVLELLRCDVKRGPCVSEMFGSTEIVQALKSYSTNSGLWWVSFLKPWNPGAGQISNMACISLPRRRKSWNRSEKRRQRRRMLHRSSRKRRDACRLRVWGVWFCLNCLIGPVAFAVTVLASFGQLPV
jgi:hypothetical protein